MNKNTLTPSSTISFADVAQGTLIFEPRHAAERLVLELIDTRWVQRLRGISQTGNTKLVYMFAEHSRFGHSLGVAYLALSLMKHFHTLSPQLVQPYENAVAAAALLHDIGHVAPGSHLAERVWAPELGGQHENISARILLEDEEIKQILSKYDPALPGQVANILLDDEALPPWTKAIISGGGWNADRGNWAIVDSAMCAVTYGRYNVNALIDAFRLTPDGQMVLHESRLDALTHFFVARDSMYRQVYQHRVLQAVDGMTCKLIVRLRDMMLEAGVLTGSEKEKSKEFLKGKKVFADETMLQALLSPNYAKELPLDGIFQMTEAWWRYHVERWCGSHDSILSDLARRYSERRLFKTIRLLQNSESLSGSEAARENELRTKQVEQEARKLGYDPRYYVLPVDDSDAHRGKTESTPMVLLDSGAIVSVAEVEPLIAQILARPNLKRRWLAVPKAVKDSLGYSR